MPDTTNDFKNILRVVATAGTNLSDLAIQNGSLIFVRDKQRIAFDYDNKRVFYNDITVLQTETERLSILAPIGQHFYFVIETARLWTYVDGWVAVSNPPEEILVIGEALPELGSAGKLYIDKTGKATYVWDEDEADYICVGRDVSSISSAETASLFQNN